jgi:hypothetical protein
MFQTLSRDFRPVRLPVVVALIALGMTSAISWAAPEAAPAHVVLNEIMYHPAADRDDLQFVELHNPGPTAVDVSGWSFTKGIEFVFSRQTELPAGGYAVICRDVSAFKARYGAQVSVAGVFVGKLSHKGERVELADARRQLVDAVEYVDHAPWPRGADGYGASLERICPAQRGDDPWNWAASEAGPANAASGTPGRRNSCLSTVPLPRISEVHFDKVQPRNPIPVSAAVADAAGVQSVALVWRVSPGENAPNWKEVPMQLESGDDHQGVYGGSIPAQPEGRLIRFTIRARSASGAERLYPSKTEPRPTFSCATFVNTNTARIPFLQVLRAGSVERPTNTRQLRALAQESGETPGGPGPSWNSTAIYLPPGGKEMQLFDYVQVRPRKGGLKIHFHKDQMFSDMTGINIIFEASPRWVLSEPLAYEVYRLAGVPAPATQHVRLWMDRRPLGYYLVVEQPNQSFLRRHGLNPDGNLYKLLWYGRSLIGQHEKKTNRQTGHADLVQLVGGLNGKSGAAQWEFIEQNFKVDRMINYYAVNMCIQNWDGFFNNYFAYHDLRPGGKWEIFPWDEDKTWGDYDGASRQYNWYEMPLTTGMNGDNPAGFSMLGGWPMARAGWWRPPGHFSGPLLANPEFRRRFLARLRVISETIFTNEKLRPVIQALEHRLEEEVPARAQLMGQDPAAALREFREHIQSFHNQVANRPKFILKQLGTER